MLWLIQSESGLDTTRLGWASIRVNPVYVAVDGFDLTMAAGCDMTSGRRSVIKPASHFTYTRDQATYILMDHC